MTKEKLAKAKEYAESDHHITSKMALEWLEEIGRLGGQLQRIQDTVDEQAEDEGLWCQALYASEAYIQTALRRLHAVIEAEPG